MYFHKINIHFASYFHFRNENPRNVPEIKSFPPFFFFKLETDTHANLLIVGVITDCSKAFRLKRFELAEINYFICRFRRYRAIFNVKTRRPVKQRRLVKRDREREKERERPPSNCKNLLKSPRSILLKYRRCPSRITLEFQFFYHS